MNFLEGVAERGAVRIHALGNRLVPAKVALPGEGRRVLMGIRPQHLSVEGGESPVRLDIRERLGGVAYDHLEMPGGARVIVETRGDETIPEGSAVVVDCDLARALFFDGETVARLR